MVRNVSKTAVTCSLPAKNQDYDDAMIGEVIFKIIHTHLRAQTQAQARVHIPVTTSLKYREWHIKIRDSRTKAKQRGRGIYWYKKRVKIFDKEIKSKLKFRVELKKAIKDIEKYWSKKKNEKQFRTNVAIS